MRAPPTGQVLSIIHFLKCVMCYILGYTLYARLCFKCYMAKNLEQQVGVSAGLMRAPPTGQVLSIIHFLKCVICYILGYILGNMAKNIEQQAGGG